MLIICCPAQRALQLHLDIPQVLVSLQPYQASLSFQSILTLISPVYFLSLSLLIFPEYIPYFLSHLFPDIFTFFPYTTSISFSLKHQFSSSYFTLSLKPSSSIALELREGYTAGEGTLGRRYSRRQVWRYSWGEVQ